MHRKSLAQRTDDAGPAGTAGIIGLALASAPRQVSGLPEIGKRTLLHDEKRADGEGVHARAIEAADGGTWVRHQRFTEKVERRVHENRSGGGFTELVQQLPEERIRLPFHSVNTYRRAVEAESLESGDWIFQVAQRSHEAAIRPAIEKFAS